MKEFKDKVAFITGAAHGFGMKFAEEAASRGMKLALLDQDDKALTELCNKLKNENIEVLELIADVTEEQEVYDAIEKVMSKYGQIDLLINDAGAATGGPIWEVPTRDWEWILHADLMSQVYTLRKVLPIMMKQENGGDVLNVASVAGLMSTAGSPMYVSTKFGVVGMTEAVAYDLQAYKQNKIHMHVFAPAFVHTNLDHTEDYRPEKYSDKNDPYYQSETFKKVLALNTKEITTGMPLDNMGKIVFKGLEDNKFYILTHPGLNPLITGRAEDAINGKAPDLKKAMSFMTKAH
ncbi:SDR family NAD(P)-dependent oxidoreductase [Lactobacillus crispatus]|jgi:NADP-dependent 3-hydroxy acid dehydrogenase YdfG|uniref:SDR family NAD(P)-dependent oxidoreductase n=1 Tax=Lactobacillus crispatus TaxID=47770 RepID=A0A7H9E766_9LACO|nr:SDR family NAD(P)-dependent oxidoreductase [Lactobacillus crispatus]QLL73470.1 SDR family NAD(P)-dependent oxidoreductase [Lactobacillus crispatus]